MTNSAPPIGRYVPAALRGAGEPASGAGEAPDQLWQDHGWGLRGGDVAALVGGLLIASYLVQWLVG